MEGSEGSEVLDTGPEGDARPRATGIIVTSVVAIGLGVTAVAAGLTWWAGRPPLSDALTIVGISVLGTERVTIAAEPPIGALSTPAGAALPGVTLRLSVGGDPDGDVAVAPSPTDAIVYVEQGPAVTIARGAFADIDITVAPVDCALAREGTDLDEDGYRWRQDFGVELLITTEGQTVPLSDAARASFGDALMRACDGAGSPPELTVTGARRGGEPPLETIGLIVDINAEADRLVVTPLDSPGLRGLGSADRRKGDGVPLLWLVAPAAEGNEEVPTAYSQVFVVRGDMAYPWIVGIPVTEDLPAMTPLTTSIR